MTSLIAIPLLALAVVWAVAFSVARHAAGCRRGGRVLIAHPVLVVLVGVLAVWLAGWLLLLAMANL